MFGHDICLKGRLYTFLIFSAFKIHNSVSLWVKITRKPNNLGRPSLCFARKQNSNFVTGCDVINRWIIGTRNIAKSWAPPWIIPNFSISYQEPINLMGSCSYRFFLTFRIYGGPEGSHMQIKNVAAN